jgi:hypothetical protein
MRLSDHTKGRAGDWPGRGGRRPTAEVVWLEEYRLRRRPQTRRWRRTVILPSPVPPPVLRHRVPIEAALIMLILISAIAGALFVLMGLGMLP